MLRIFRCLLASALLLPLASLQAKALHGFDGPFEITPDNQLQPVADGVYHRETHPRYGGVVVIATSRLGDDVRNPDDGDTWALSIVHAPSGQVLGLATMQYDAARDCILFNGSPIHCEVAVPPGESVCREFWTQISFETQCIATDDYALRVEFLGSEIEPSPFAFRPTRFAPKIVHVAAPDSIAPRLPGDSFSQYGVGADPVPPGVGSVTAVVRDHLGCNRPLEGVEVTLKNTIEPHGGGHTHFESSDEPGSGTYAPRQYGGTVSDAHVITGVSASDGIYQATYTAGVLGVREEIEVTASLPKAMEPFEEPAVSDQAEAGLDIRVGGLVELAPGENGEFVFRDGGTCPHPTGTPNASAATWMGSDLRSRLVALAGIYTYMTNGRLSFNDASLPYGGFYDNKDALGRDSGCHDSHRRGIDIDVNTKADGSGRNMREFTLPFRGKDRNLMKILSLVAEDLHLEVIPEGNSLHYRCCMGQ